MNIPLVDLKIQHQRVWEEVRPKWDAIFSNTSFILGAAVSEFERSFADFSGVKHCVGVANGGDAVELALRALDIGFGDEVVIPANTFTATAMAVQRIGARPVLVDVDPEFQLIDPKKIELAVSPRTKAIVPVHLFGQLAPMKEVLDIAQSFGLKVVEDAAQCQGATQGRRHAGTFGDAAATSFYPGKNLGAYGDGGAVLTENDDLADRLRCLRNYGGTAKYEHSEVGYNSRLDSLQAAVLSVKLSHLSSWNAERNVIAHEYTDLLKEIHKVQLPLVRTGNYHVWHLFVVQVEERDRILAGLNSAGIGAGIHYPTPIHLQPAFKYLKRSEGSFPVSEALSRKILSLPIYPGMTRGQCVQVAETLKDLVTEN